MNNDIFEKSVLDYLNGELSIEQVKEFEVLKDSHVSKQQVYNEIKIIWELAKAEETETPDESLRVGFYSMLATHQLEENGKSSVFQKVESFLANIAQRKRIGQLTMAFMIALASTFIGYQLNANSSNLEKIALNHKIEKLNQKVMKLQLKSVSAPVRIEAVNYLVSSNLKEDKIIENLINKLLYDENLHVRMVAGKSLILFKQHQQVKSAILDAVRSEKELLVKATLIDILIEIDKNTALKEIYRIYEHENPSPEMKVLYKDLVESKNI